MNDGRRQGEGRAAEMVIAAARPLRGALGGGPRRRQGWMALAAAAMVAPLGFALTAHFRAERAGAGGAGAAFERPGDLLWASCAAILGVVVGLTLRWIGRSTRRPVPLGPFAVAFALFGLGLVMSYTLDPLRLQRQLRGSLGVADLQIPPLEGFPGETQVQRLRRLESPEYVVHVNATLDEHNRKARERRERGECEGRDAAPECALVPPLARLADVRARLGLDGTFRAAVATFGGLFALIALVWLGTAGREPGSSGRDSALRRGRHRFRFGGRAWSWLTRPDWFGELVAWRWLPYALLISGVALQFLTRIRNEDTAAAFTLFGLVTSPIVLMVVGLGLGLSLVRVGPSLGRRGGDRLTYYPMLLRESLLPYSLWIALVIALAFSQRDIGTAGVIAVAVAVQIAVTFRPRRSFEILAIIAILAVIGIWLATRPALSGSRFGPDLATATSRVRNAWDPYGRYRAAGEHNVPVFAFERLLADADCAPPLEEELRDQKKVSADAALTARRADALLQRNRALQRCIAAVNWWLTDRADSVLTANARAPVGGTESLPPQRSLTRAEYREAESLLADLRRTEPAGSPTLAARVAATRDRLREFICADPALWPDELRRAECASPGAERRDDNEQNIQAQYLLKSAGLFGNGLGTPAVERLPNSDVDFPAALVADQLGALGFLALCISLYALVALGVGAGRSRPVYMHLAIAAAAQLGAYGLISLVGTLGFPASGVPFPFIAKGGTAFIASMVLVAAITMAAARPGGQPSFGRVRPPALARALIVSPRWPLGTGVAGWALVLWPALAIMCYAFVQPFAAVERVAPWLAEPIGAEPLGAPLHPRAPGRAPLAARQILVAGPDGGEPVVIADRDGTGTRTFPEAAAPTVPGAGDPRTIASSLAGVLGAADGAPVEGIEALYAAGAFGGCDRQPCDVLLTIDAELQGSLRRALLEAFPPEGRATARAAAIAIEADTGAIRALVSLPEPSLDDLSEAAADRRAQIAYESSGAVRIGLESGAAEDPQPFANRALTGAYTPGSVAKLITLGCAVDAGVVNRETRLLDPGNVAFGRAEVKHENFRAAVEARKPGSGEGLRWSPSEAFGWSLNGWFARAAWEMGRDGYTACIERLGVRTGRAPHLEIPFPLPAIQSDLSPAGIESDQLFADAGYGQSTWRSNPFHLAVITASVARGGELPAPQIIAGIRDRDGAIQPAPNSCKSGVGRAWSAQTATLLDEVMIESNTPGRGFAGNAWAGQRGFDPLIDAAGAGRTGAKTGTAQQEGRTSHAWVIALARNPDNGRALAFALVLEQGDAGERAVQALQRALHGGVARAILSRPGC